MNVSTLLTLREFVGSTLLANSHLMGRYPVSQARDGVETPGCATLGGGLA